MTEHDQGLAGASEPASRLRERPDWLYLMREFKELYRLGRAGGSKKIRAHQRAVREAIAKTMTSDPVVQPRLAEEKPATAHLKRALDQGLGAPTQSVIRAIDSVTGELAWLYGYERMPRGLGKKYAYAEFAGPHGPVVTEHVILGVVLFAPSCTYPAHAHDGLTESYVVLSGAVSENDEGVYVPGSLILNPPGRMHRITVGDAEPALLAYAWHGSAAKLAKQEMNFKRPKA